MGRTGWLAPLLLVLAAACEATEPADRAAAAPASEAWQEDFGLAGRTLESAGRAPFFVLEPGFQLVLANEEGDEELTITVLESTMQIGALTARVVEERETEDGELVEISYNYFAIDPETRDVFYFGEAVDVYKDGAVSGHPGAWLAGEKDARAGLIVPGAPRIGQRYYQEIAPGEALDRAEVVSLSHTLATPAGTFEHCLRTEETSGLHPREREFKTYAPGIGLIQDEDLLLVRFGGSEGR